MADGKSGPGGAQTSRGRDATADGGTGDDAPVPWYDRAHERFEQWNRPGAEVDTSRFEGVAGDGEHGGSFDDLLTPTDQTTDEAVDRGGR